MSIKAAVTLENSCQVLVVGSRVPELDSLVGLPGDARVHQRNLDLCAVEIFVKELQCVCNNRKDG